MADERDSTASGASHFMRPWTAAHHHDDALPLQLTTFALCATHLEPRVSFCTGTFARAEPPQACRIRPGTVRYGTSTALGCETASTLLLCLSASASHAPCAGSGMAASNLGHGAHRAREAPLSTGRVESHPRPQASCGNRHCASPPSASV